MLISSAMNSFCTFRYIILRDFAGAPVVKNPPCNAGAMGSVPGQGTKTPYAVQRLSTQATTELEPQVESLAVATTEAHVLWGPSASTTEPQLESPCIAMKDPT